MNEWKETREVIKDETHVRIQTLGCGEIIAPLSHVTLHKVGPTHRVLLRDCTEWREISSATYQLLSGLIDYA